MKNEIEKAVKEGLISFEDAQVAKTRLSIKLDNLKKANEALKEELKKEIKNLRSIALF